MGQLPAGFFGVLFWGSEPPRAGPARGGELNPRKGPQKRQQAAAPRLAPMPKIIIILIIIIIILIIIIMIIIIINTNPPRTSAAAEWRPPPLRHSPCSSLCWAAAPLQAG